jgi:type II secretory pathway component PulF
MEQNRSNLTGFLQGIGLVVAAIVIIGIVIAMLPTAPLR